MPLELKVRRTHAVFYEVTVAPPAVVRAWLEAFGRRDVDALLALTSPDLEPARWVGTERGHDAVRALLHRQS